jgi:hypothetical protein
VRYLNKEIHRSPQCNVHEFDDRHKDRLRSQKR